MNGVLYLLAWYAIYMVVLGLPLFIIAHKSAHPLKWLALIPVVSFYLQCDMADAELWWLLLLFIPYLNIIFDILLWGRIAENTNKPSWLGVLMVIPIVSTGVAYYMAFVDNGELIA